MEWAEVANAQNRIIFWVLEVTKFKQNLFCLQKLKKTTLLNKRKLRKKHGREPTPLALKPHNVNSKNRNQKLRHQCRQTHCLKSANYKPKYNKHLLKKRITLRLDIYRRNHRRKNI